MANKTNVQTSTGTGEVDLSDLGIPGAESALLPENGKNNKTRRGFFDVRPVNNTAFLDKPDNDEEPEEEEEEDNSQDTDAGAGTGKGAAKKKAQANPDPDEEEEEANEDEEAEEEEDDDNTPDELKDKGGKTGRPNSMISAVKKLIEKKVLVPFDDDKPLDQYTTADAMELIEANFQDREQRLREELPEKFFASLPTEFQIAAQYFSDGGTDLKPILRALSAVEEVKALDPKNEPDQPQIIRQFLRATGFGTEEEIDDEIAQLKDRGVLADRATKFKPKLDKMQEQQVSSTLAHQEAQKEKQKEAAKQYMENAYAALESGKLGDLPIDTKTQRNLYAGLVQPNYPSITGRPTNLLGHLLEKHQYLEPNLPLVAEALWLLSDPAGYRKKLQDAGANKKADKVARQLKTEEARKNTSTLIEDDEDNNKKGRKIQRNNGAGFFSRRT